MKNFNDYPEFLSSKQMLDLTGWSRSTLWRYTGPGGKLSHIKITALGKNKPPLFDKNKLHSYLTNGYSEGQFGYEIFSVYNLGKYNSNRTEPFNNGNGSDQPEGIYKPKEDLKNPTNHDKNGDQSEGIYKPKKNPKKPTGHDKNGNNGNKSGKSKDPKKSDSPDKNGNGGGDHGQSL